MRINGSFPGIDAAQGAGLDGATGAGDGSFADDSMAMLAQAEKGQRAADQQAAALAQGEGNVHEAALSLEKADIQMRLLMKARNKIVEAYQEMMRMPV